ncbi:MAG: nucleoside monophosphate kinase [Candidatus Nanoarchaeia archaeon]|nr:nucleoside monophosphate kinase [Candidatus Nanoarchaeia archaeon]MDD5239485.1 nucleoside monophosphate kinase [Candidatus Nanoarchaeia archaeon]
MVKLAMLGPPGSGKGTYATRMAPKLEVPAVSTGELLRANRDDPKLGPEIRKGQDSGGLVPDKIVMAVLQKRLAESDAKKGFILDGFPRTIEQAESLEKFAKLDAVINLVVPERVIIARLSSRRQCSKCSAIYNTLYLKTKVEGICDKCGGELYQRSDDKPESIKERLKVYEKSTAPLIDYYGKKGVRIDIPCNSVDVPPDEQVAKIMKALKDKRVIQ